jgi:hypothetical protein
VCLSTLTLAASIPRWWCSSDTAKKRGNTCQWRITITPLKRAFWKKRNRLPLIGQVTAIHLDRDARWRPGRPSLPLDRSCRGDREPCGWDRACNESRTEVRNRRFPSFIPPHYLRAETARENCHRPASLLIGRDCPLRRCPPIDRGLTISGYMNSRFSNRRRARPGPQTRRTSGTGHRDPDHHCCTECWSTADGKLASERQSPLPHPQDWEPL